MNNRGNLEIKNAFSNINAYNFYPKRIIMIELKGGYKIRKNEKTF